MNLSATMSSQLTLVETITTPYVAPSDATVTTNGLNETVTLNGSTSPAATKASTYQKALSAGTGTIDLTSLPGLTGDETVNGTGLKVELAKFTNPGANAIAIVGGASNGYLIFGTAGKLTLPPGSSAGPFRFNGGLAAIDSSHKTIDISGTGTDVLGVSLVMG